MVQDRKVLQALASDYAPYAPVKSVLEVITRRRQRGLPDPVTLQVLESISIPTGNTPRTLQALRFLGLLRDDGSHTEAFDNLARAAEAEYPELLAEVVRAAYHSVFIIADPANDTSIVVADAFRQYRPEAQRQRMVTLFMGLCEAAGIVDRPVRQRRPSQSGELTRRTTQRARKAENESEPCVHQPGGDEDRSFVQNEQTSLDYRLISVVVQQLPSNGRWTSRRRELWVQAMTATVDLMVEIVDQPGETEDHPTNG